jgi:hypothetical protein
MSWYGWLSIAAGSGAAVLLSAATAQDSDWTTQFFVQTDELSAQGRNPYFILEPGYTLRLEDEDVQLVITVLNETRRVDNVETRVVEERETEDGKLIEVSRNFFAISKRTNSVFYFGEEVDIYKDGKITSHEGAWLSGVNGARFGLMMPGLPLVKARYYQEIAPRVAMDRAEIASVSDQFSVPAGRFQNVLRVTETTPLEPSAKEDKYYAAGVGLLRDGSLKLVSYGQRAAPR